MTTFVTYKLYKMFKFLVNVFVHFAALHFLSEISSNIAISKARRIRKISVFTSGGKFSVFTLSYVNTTLNQSAFRIHIMLYYNMVSNIFKLGQGDHARRLIFHT